jgi:hypothetical protein
MKNITGALVECKEALVIFIFNGVPGYKNICPAATGTILLPARSFKATKSAGAAAVEPEDNARHPINDPVMD